MTINSAHIHAGLMSQIACGDKQALELLYKTISPRLFGIILRIVRRRDWAEEILHDTFIHIWQSALYYDDKRSEPQIWLNHIARNRAIDYLRKHENRCCSVEDISEAEDMLRSPLAAEDVHLEAKNCMTAWSIFRQNSVKASPWPIIAGYRKLKLRCH